MGNVLSFGELLLRLSPDTEGQWLANAAMPIHVGGAELNVARALALWNIPVKYMTGLPDNYLSQQIVKNLQQSKIDTSAIQFGGQRIGIYYLPQGLDVKNAGVIYDRADSSFARLQKGTINWDAILEGVSWFHVSAICPALNADAADVCEEVMQVCNKKGITVSIDLNYRAKLWQYGVPVHEVMMRLAPYCDLIMGNVWAAEKMLQIPVHPNLVTTDTKEMYLEQALATSQQIIKQYPRCKAVANTFRFDHNGILYYTTLYTKSQLHVSSVYTTETVVDKVGSGDCYMAGLIYGFYKEQPAQDIVEFATAAAFQKLFIKGDATNKSVEEIAATIKKA
ncbi:carbohydrate kinase [Niastella koreensis]|uniref:PfkB domain protein n=2 Tax=Niastella koreensis TaxID=354356 RepID=G8TDT1_NIAKG|nr:sugar kinase [Niastella koreensis]AEW01531.1 PfkB domain protein [Niastella koreensis GR20-10]OQP48252.1 carbohydrate kinase [Niastella koreensis]